MLRWAVIFFVIAVLAALAGFGDIPTALAVLARIAALVCILLFIAALVWFLKNERP